MWGGVVRLSIGLPSLALAICRASGLQANGLVARPGPRANARSSGVLTAGPLFPGLGRARLTADRDWPAPHLRTASFNPATWIRLTSQRCAR